MKRETKDDAWNKHRHDLKESEPSNLLDVQRGKKDPNRPVNWSLSDDCENDERQYCIGGDFKLQRPARRIEVRVEYKDVAEPDRKRKVSVARPDCILEPERLSHEIHPDQSDGHHQKDEREKTKDAPQRISTEQRAVVIATA